MTITLQCCVCQTRVEFVVTPRELGSLRDSGVCFKPCPACKRSTYWACPSTDDVPGTDRRVFPRESAVSKPPKQPKQPEALPEGHPGSRGPRRVALELPVRVRGLGSDVWEELTVTADASKTGLYFLSDKPLQVGQELRVAVNYSKSAAGELEQHARVVRIVAIPASSKKGIAVEYL